MFHIIYNHTEKVGFVKRNTMWLKAPVHLKILVCQQSGVPGRKEDPMRMKS